MNLHDIIRSGSFLEVLHAINAGADINAPGGFYNDTPLHVAVDSRKTDIVRLLLSKGCNCSTPSHCRGGQTPLHEAMLYGRNDIGRQLIDAGACVNQKGRNSMTPLHLAAITGNEAMAEELIAAGAEIEAKTEDGWTPLKLAADHGNRSLAELLIDKGADDALLDNDGRTESQTDFWKTASWRSRTGKTPEEIVERIKSKYMLSLSEFDDALDQAVDHANSDGLGISVVSPMRPYGTRLQKEDSPQAALMRIAALETDYNEMLLALIAQERVVARIQGFSDREIEEGQWEEATLYDDNIHSWGESFAEWQKRECCHIKDMIRDNPCFEHIDMLIDLFIFGRDWHPGSSDLLDFLFSLPPEAWEVRYLERLEAIGFNIVWENWDCLALMIEDLEQFRHKRRLLLIFEAWANELSQRIAKDWIPPALSPEKDLLQKIFGRETPASMLKELHDVLSKFSQSKDTEV